MGLDKTLINKFLEKYESVFDAANSAANDYSEIVIKNHTIRFAPSLDAEEIEEVENFVVSFKKETYETIIKKIKEQFRYYHIEELNPPVSPVCGNVAPKMTSSNMDKFAALSASIARLYARKNNAYGDSFTKSVTKYGPTAALTRISDKFNRIENLILNGGNTVADEKLTDTLMDMASYSLMTIIALTDDSSFAELLKNYE